MKRGLFSESRLLFAAENAFRHCRRENDQQKNTSPNRKAVSERGEIENRRSDEQQNGFESVLTALDDGGNTDDGDRHDQPRIGRDRADGVAYGERISAARRAQTGNDKFGQRRGDADNGGADDEMRNSRYFCDPACGVHKEIPAFDDEHKPHGKQDDESPKRPACDRKHTRILRYDFPM